MSTKSDFMAAEEIKAVLNGREKGEQERILRWVTESLGLVSTIAHLTETPLQHTSPSTAPTGPVPVASAAGARPKDIRTFAAEKKPKTDIQFAAVTAYYYRFEAPTVERKDAITADDLQEAGRQARGYGFTKPIVTLSNALKQGVFNRAGRGEFKLNAVGENLVAMTLPGSDVEAGSARPRSRNQKRASRPVKKKAS